MTYNENLTNKELVRNAMPLKGLSREQWNSLLCHVKNLAETNVNPLLESSIKILLSNQSKLEVMDLISVYYINELNEPVKDYTVKELNII